MKDDFVRVECIKCGLIFRLFNGDNHCCPWCKSASLKKVIKEDSNVK